MGKEGGGKFCWLLELPVSPFGERLGALFLRFSGCFASVFPSSHSSRPPASLVSPPCVKAGKTRPTQRPRYAEQGGKKKTLQKTRQGWWRWKGGGECQRRTSSPRNRVILGGRVWNRCVASKVKLLEDVRILLQSAAGLNIHGSAAAYLSERRLLRRELLSRRGAQLFAVVERP